MAYVISLSPEDAAKFAELWRANATNNELRKIFGISEQTIQRISKQMGLPSRSVWSGPKFDWTHLDQQMIDMQAAGMKWTTIADALNVSVGAARNRWAMHVAPRLRNQGATPPVVTGQDLALMQWVRGLPAHHPVKQRIEEARA